MFERFQLPDVAAVARRTMLGAVVAAVLGVVVLLLFNETWAALGLCIGIGLGISNFRLIVRSVLRAGRRQDGNKRRPLAMNTLGRLMAMTVVALVLAWVEVPLGLGVIGGLAIFQFLLLASVTRSMLKAGGTGGAGGGLALLFGAALTEASSDSPGAADHAEARRVDAVEIGDSGNPTGGGAA